ncbi:TonB-dependent siderophore receptor [Methylomonas sp. MED-D]|uniref:TonB-dependent siderophore receptor n=1 Tax=unclassified Methylomonas TaxID=2608980 RepID=UPI0028A4D04A|nr:TonB-dependent receptor [Methylomonas sp. MV1]MDT4329083.1 TonB-dependent receptor [Methylomonas sp. MV1]
MLDTGSPSALLLKKRIIFPSKNNPLKNLLNFFQFAVPVFQRLFVLANENTTNGEKPMSNTHHRCDPGFRSSRLSHAIQGILLASALTASVVAQGEEITNRKSYHIGGGSLGQALSQFARDAGILFTGESKLTDGKTSKGLDGEYTVEEGFRKLLAGSGLTYTITDDNSVAIKVAGPGSDAASTLPAVKVSAAVSHEPEIDTSETYKITNSRTATKTDTPLIETPFSLQAVTQEVINDQQSIRVEDALRNVSNIMTQTPNGGQFDGFVVRGVPQATLFKDGFRFPSKDYAAIGPRDLSNIDRIEVLKGPASLMYGRIEPGGMINLVTKQPLETAHYSLQQQIGSFDHYRTVADATGPLTDDKSLLYRINLGYESTSSFIDFNGTDRVSVAPRLRWKPSDDTVFDLEYQHLQGDVTTFTGVPAITLASGGIVGNRPLPLNRSFFKGEPYNGLAFNEDMVDFNWSHNFNKDWKINQRFSYDHSRTSGEFTLGLLFKDNMADLLRRESEVQTEQDTFSTGIDLTGNFKTFGYQHTLLAGADYYHTDMQQAYNSIYPGQLGGRLLNVYNPIHNSVKPIFDPNKAKLNNVVNDWFGLYLQDQFQLPFDLQLLTGLRYDEARVQQVVNIRNPVERPQGITEMKNTTGVVKPRVGLVWHPIKEFSLYGNYVENLGNTPLTTVGSSLKAEQAQQWEVGAKTELADGRLTASLAYYELTKQNTPVPYLDTGYMIPVGEARSQGVELDITGEVLQNWKIIASYAHMNTEITKDASGLQGHQLSNAPRNSGSLWNTYAFDDDLLRGFKVGAGVVARSQRQGDPENDFQLPGYAIFNLMAGYELKIGKTKLSAQFNVENLLDKYYFSESGGFRGASIYGTPRSYIGTLRLDF